MTRIGRNKLRAYSALIDSALQTRQVSSAAGKALHVQSPTRSVVSSSSSNAVITSFSHLNLEGNQGVNVNATSGNINIETLNDVKIDSRNGKVSGINSGE